MKTIKKVGFIMRKRSPEILMVTGLSTTIIGTVLVGKASVKAYKANELLQTQFKEIEEVYEKISREEYTD